MPHLSPEQKQAIKDLRRDGASQAKTAEVLEIDERTVRKHDLDGDVDTERGWDPVAADYDSILSDDTEPIRVVNPDFLDVGDGSGSDEEPEEVEPERSDGYTGPPPEEAGISRSSESDDSMVDDYSSLSPGEFIRTFFETFEVGVKDKFLRIQARRADRREKIPDEERMKSELKEMSSGVGKDIEASYIAEEYWAEAQRYIRSSSTTTYRSDMADDIEKGDSGEFVSPEGGQGDGQWMQIPGQGMVFGKMVEGPGGAKQFQPMQPPQQAGGGQFMRGQQPGQQMSGMGVQQSQDPVGREIQKLRNEVREVRNGGDGQDELVESVRQITEMNNALEELQGDDGSDQYEEQLHALQQQIQELRQAAAEDMQRQSTGDVRQDAVRQMMADGNVDSETLMEFVEKIERPTDPEVRKHELEMEKERTRMNRKKESREQIFETVQGMVSSFGSALGEKLAESPGQSQPQQSQHQQPQPQGQPQGGPVPNGGQPQGQPQGAGGVTVQQNGHGQAQQQPPTADLWECPECGEESPQDPRSPGVECPECDYSLQPCPECSVPVEIPPEEEIPRAECPECTGPVFIPNDGSEQAACEECEWAGTPDETGAEPVVCDNCGMTAYPQPSPKAGM